ncbi:Sec1 domain-containing protein 2 [Basidiobolus ranarum]|uniref:Sec1 domain-containing protein 2 n=1 Tax=Basidiobolus ranarum TaxID=34480 RepID=A0ABR2W0B9_9FUNG
MDPTSYHSEPGPLYSVSKNIWDTFKFAFEGSVVYTDDATTQMMKWSCPGGALNLLENGAVNIKSLAEEADIINNKDDIVMDFNEEDPQKAIFLLSSVLSNYEEQIKTILRARTYWQSEVYTAIPERMQAPQAGYEYRENLDGEYFKDFAVRMRKWMTTDRELPFPPIAQVSFAPILWASITHDLFLLPGFTQSIPYLKPATPENSPLLTRPTTVNTDPATKKELQKLAFTLAAILEVLHFKGEYFALGEAAKFVARQAIAVDRNKHYDNTASVVIIDRSLDLVAPSMRSDNILDQVYSILKRPTPDSLDVDIKPEFLTSKKGVSTFEKDVEPPCSLAHGMDTDCIALMDELIMATQKEALNIVRQRLADIITEENINVKVPKVIGKVTPIQLMRLISGIRENEETLEKYSNLLELIAAIVDTLKESPKMMWDELFGVQKILALSISESPQSTNLIQHFAEILPKKSGEKLGRSKTNFSIQDVLATLAFAYSLGGNDLYISEDEEVLFQDKLLQAIMNQGEVPGILEKEDLAEFSEEEQSRRSWERKLIIEGWLETIFRNLHNVSEVRNHLSRYRVLYQPAAQQPYSCLIQQVVSDIFTTAMLDQDMPEELEYIPRGTLGRVMTGFRSRLLKVSSPHPAHHPVMIIFVIGGITFTEVRTIREVVARSNRHITVMIGSTDIATGSTVYHYLSS